MGIRRDAHNYLTSTYWFVHVLLLSLIATALGCYPPLSLRCTLLHPFHHTRQAWNGLDPIQPLPGVLPLFVTFWTWPAHQ